MNQYTSRRHMMMAVGAGVLGSVAGCLGSDDTEDSGQTATASQGDDDQSGAQTESPEAIGSEGLVYAFASNRIAMIDPETGEVVDDITDSIDENEWSAVVITHDHSQVFAIEQSLSQAVVINTETRVIDATIDIGPSPVHMYHPKPNEVWAHSDAEGAFYVIDRDTLAVETIVEAGLDGEGHGKLLHHEDFGEKAYAGNVNDPAAHIIDLEAYERTDSISFGKDGGTHYKAYTPESGHAYFERSGDIQTTAVIDTETDEFVDELPYAGAMSLSPDESVLGLLDEGTLRILDATSEESTELDSVSIDGIPAVARFFTLDEGLYAAVATTDSAAIVVISVADGEIVDQIPAGEVSGQRRAGVSGDSYFITPADADGTVAIVYMADRDHVETVAVGDGVDTVLYIGDSGTGYLGR
ncbi:hypothetical protein [Natronocalculus amylovorans]|uniref:Uncharacterized protein n=1 Tax=Natronocalculus amylovorans TaxID=2917812 RepID=A0AAE3FWN6_9EURY|nr:hypothetical protein [Natronocalculus amylovorans]MCL9816616.1 hypothetical protein [Natronocalculus amylovorans]